MTYAMRLSLFHDEYQTEVRMDFEVRERNPRPIAGPHGRTAAKDEGGSVKGSGNC